MTSTHTTTAAGLKAAICQCCGRHARATPPDADGDPNLWKMGRGLSQAPFPADHQHDDASVGSRYTCPTCNRLLRRGHRLATRGGQTMRRVE